MLFDSIKLVEGSERQNLTVDTGSTFPPKTMVGQLFYRVDGINDALYVFNGTDWTRIEDQNSALKFTPLNKAGDTMTGVLTLAADPVLPLQAATKQYVDGHKVSWTNIIDKPTTAGQYGITDAQPLDSDLTALAGITVAGILARTGSGTASARVLTGSARITVSNGDGVSGNPTFDLAPVGAAGSYAQVTVDGYGRVTSGAPTLDWTNISNHPTTISGYGLTDAQPKDPSLTSIAALTGTGVLKHSGTTWSLDNSFAPLNSPALTGTPTAPTAVTSSNSTQIATTAFVSAAIASSATAFQGGAVSSANKWTTARALNLSGDASATFAAVDGTADVTATITFAAVNTTPGSFGNISNVPTISVNSKGLITGITTNAIAISTGQVNSGTFADARIAQSNITQHQASLSINESQIPDGTLLARVAGNETITGAWSFSALVKNSVGSIAAAGSTQATATAISTNVVVIASATVGTAQGVILPSAVGAQVIIINPTAVAINVYPPSLSQVDALGSNVPFSLPAGAKIMFVATSANQYYTLNATYA